MDSRRFLFSSFVVGCKHIHFLTAPQKFLICTPGWKHWSVWFVPNPVRCYYKLLTHVCIRNTLTIFSFIIYILTLWAIPIAFLPMTSVYFQRNQQETMFFILFHSACHCFDILQLQFERYKCISVGRKATNNHLFLFCL